MEPHKSLWDRLTDRFIPDAEPKFEVSVDPTLVTFAQIYADSSLDTFDANKHLRTDALSPIYDCETESRRQRDTEVERFSVSWAPVWQKNDPLTGFRGRDSAFTGSTPTVAMPPDERTAALLLLVTTTFIHLSAGRVDGQIIVRGASEDDDGGYHFVELSPDRSIGDDVAITASGPGEPIPGESIPG